MTKRMRINTVGKAQAVDVCLRLSLIGILRQLWGPHTQDTEVTLKILDEHFEVPPSEIPLYTSGCPLRLILGAGLPCI